MTETLYSQTGLALSAQTLKALILTDFAGPEGREVWMTEDERQDCRLILDAITRKSLTNARKAKDETAPGEWQTVRPELDRLSSICPPLKIMLMRTAREHGAVKAALAH